MIWLLAVQVSTFVALGVCFLVTGDVRLGSAQLLLALLTAILYFPN